MTSRKREVRPDDFPRGFAEVDERPPFPRVIPTFRDEIIYDVGLRFYGEFFASLETGWRLLQDGMTLDGVEGTVSVVCRFENAVQMKWRPIDPDAERQPPRIIYEQ